MSTVMVHAGVSVDGFIADRNDEVGPLFDWYFNGEVPIGNSPGMKVSKASGEYVNGMWASIESTVMGRHLFDLTNGWEGTPPAGRHLVVVSHRPRPEGWHPGASCWLAAEVAAGRVPARAL